jgi:hypothetical protein
MDLWRALVNTAETAGEFIEKLNYYYFLKKDCAS